MRILELRFRNLNSLYGEWVIDFTHPEYLGNGIFALTGPTGAGKSTILDAICLALYGATPRLGKITKSGNEIMSRQTGECYSEVLFESQSGQFRCHWEQRRARKMPGGKLQEQEHQIAEHPSGLILQAKKSLVAPLVEEKTGMDFDRFTRSMLLAQGGFDTFLKADLEEKSKILEQITGTQIYSELSRRAYERHRHERETLSLLTAETSGIFLLSSDEEQGLCNELNLNLAEEKYCSQKAAELVKAVAWLSNVESLRVEIVSLSQEAVTLEKRVKAFEPERARYELAMKAFALEGAHTMVTALRQQRDADERMLMDARAEIPKLESEVRVQAERLLMLEKESEAALVGLKAALPVFQKVRGLDQTIATQTQQVAETEKGCQLASQQLELDKVSRQQESRKLLNAQNLLNEAELYLKENARDEWLVSGFGGLESQFEFLLKREGELNQVGLSVGKAKALKTKAELLHLSSTEERARHESALTAATSKLNEGRAALSRMLAGRLLREYRAQKESLLREMAFRQRIELLEEHRARLEAGAECPLCGSVEHPFAESGLPTPNDVEQTLDELTSTIERAEIQERANARLEQVEVTAKTGLNEAVLKEQAALKELDSANSALVEREQAYGELQAELMSSKHEMNHRLKPLGVLGVTDADAESLLNELKSRLDTWLGHTKQVLSLEKDLAFSAGEVRRLDDLVERQDRALSERRNVLKSSRDLLASIIEERQTLFGQECPDRSEVRLNYLVQQAQQSEKSARGLYAELQGRLTKAEARIAALLERVEQGKVELGEAESKFLSALSSAGFSSEAEFLEARLEADERRVLSEKARVLENSITELSAKRDDRKERLSQELTKALTDESLEALNEQRASAETSLRMIRDGIATLKHRLNENSLAKERIKERRQAIEAQRIECARWDKLHELMGSADGKKFRNFAQGLTFELLVGHANRQLQKMTDRYLLSRDDRDPLELNVVDNYQAGEVRTTRNLSGGESFIVSLALALGLSKMASRQVRVDSLFLDEGFGTLDEDALETALDTLSSVQQEGKLIGIISHVGALKERILTQVLVQPKAAGRSVLVGPGCRRC